MSRKATKAPLRRKTNLATKASRLFGKQTAEKGDDDDVFDAALDNVAIQEGSDESGDDSEEESTQENDSGFSENELDAQLRKGDEDDEDDEDFELDGEFDDEEDDDEDAESSDITDSEAEAVSESEFNDEELEDEDEDELEGEVHKSTIRAKKPVPKGKGFKVIRPKYALQEIIPEYDADSSDEESKNTVGRINMKVYDNLPHIGYDKFGKKIMKSEAASQDAVDKFLANTDNAETWRSVFNELEGENVVLNNEDLDLLRRIEANKAANGMESTAAEEKAHADQFLNDTMVTPVTGAPEPKSRFIPSKHEARRIMQIVRGIRNGTINPDKPKQKRVQNEVFNLWDNDDDESIQRPLHIAAPKMRLPSHIESYNPPAEYLLTDAEREEWEKTDPSERQRRFIPQKYQSLRAVPAYNRFIQERFDRCLDLYLSPRAIKKRIQVDPEALIPKLPDPKDLEPYPTSLAIVYQGHGKCIRSVSVDPTGQWLASGSDDCSIKIWEVSTGRCLRTYTLDEPISYVTWNPNKTLGILAACCGEHIYLFAPSVHNDETNETTDILLASIWDSQASKNAQWERPTVEELSKNIAVHIVLSKTITYLSWHRKGDYLVSVSPDAASKAVLIHQLSKKTTQSPFSKSKGLVQRAMFHPTLPLLYVATQQAIRVYDLVKQALEKKLQANCKWISSMDIHPGGDNVIVGSYDRKLCWFETDLSTKPYKTLRYHQFAVRDVSFHKHFPLFASCGDDGAINVFHGMVYNDLLQNPLIVPVKRLSAHKNIGGVGAVFCEFHPSQPWIFSCGSDGLIKLFT